MLTSGTGHIVMAASVLGLVGSARMSRVKTTVINEYAIKELTVALNHPLYS